MKKIEAEEQFGSPEHIERWRQEQKQMEEAVPEPIRFADWIRLTFNPRSNVGEWWNRENNSDAKIYTTVELYELFQSGLALDKTKMK